MLFQLNNVLAIFSRVVFATFKEFICKFLKVCFDYYTIFALIKLMVESLRLMLDTYRRYQITLNLKKCLFFVPFGNLFRNAVCKHGLMVDPMMIMVIMNLESPRIVKKMHATLGHIGYYINFIKIYATITSYMETLLKKDVMFFWNDHCKKILDIMKENMVNTSILVFLD